MKPSEPILRQYLLGALTPDDAGQVETWLENDPSAAECLGGVVACDVLTGVLAKSAPSETMPDAAVERIVHGVLQALQAPPAVLATKRGEYQLLREIGKGGMGAVWQAKDQRLKRPVAVKVIHPDRARFADAKARFLREAQAAAAISHDNVVPVYHVGEDQEGLFIVMPLLGGESLQGRLERTGCLPAAEVMRLGREVAAGLAAAHARGLMHRDIKPSNIWLDAEAGRAKILDFGLARADDGVDRLTETGAFAGTPAYMAPEHMDGNPTSQSDLFSLGATLYECATGKPAFAGRTLTALQRAVADYSPPPPHTVQAAVPRPLSDLIMQLLSKKAADRPKSASAVVQQFADLAAQQPASARRSHVPFHRLLVAAAVLLTASLVLAQIVIRITDKQGKVTEMTAPEGAKVEVIPPVTREGPTDAPLSALALVSRPTRLAGAQSWSLAFRSHFGPVNALAYQPGGQLLASGGEDGTVRLWQADTGKLVRVFMGHAGPLVSIVWMPDGKTLVSEDAECKPRFWDVASGKLLRTLTLEASEKILVTAWSPDRKTIAGIMANHRLRFWDVDGGPIPGKPLNTPRQYHDGGLPRGTPRLSKITWSPDGKKVCLNYIDTGGLWICDFASRDVSVLSNFRSYNGQHWAWSPDSKTIATVALNGATGAVNGIVEVGTGKILQTFAGALNAPTWSPDGKTLSGYSFANNDPCFLLDVESGERRQLPGAQMVSTAWNSTSDVFADGGDDGVIRFFDRASGKLLRTSETDAEPKFMCAGINVFAWAPDGKILATAGAKSRNVWLWDSRTGAFRILEEDFEGTSLLAWSPDGHKLAICVNHGHIWEAATAKKLAFISTTRDLAWSPDSRLLASVRNGDPMIQRFDTDDQRCLLDRKKEDCHVAQVAWSPDGKTVACASSLGAPDRNIRFLDADSGKVKQVLDRQAPAGVAVECVVWSPDGNTLASRDQTGIYLWDKSGKLLRAIAHGRQVSWGILCWSPDSNYVISEDGRIWEAATGKAAEASALVGRVGTCGGKVLVYLDGKVLASNDGNSGIHFWDATGASRGIVIPLRYDSGLVIHPSGHYRGPTGVERELVFVVQTENGQETLRLEDFARKYGWQNDPAKGRLAE